MVYQRPVELALVGSLRLGSHLPKALLSQARFITHDLNILVIQQGGIDDKLDFILDQNFRCLVDNS